MTEGTHVMHHLADGGYQVRLLHVTSCIRYRICQCRSTGLAAVPIISSKMKDSSLSLTNGDYMSFASINQKDRNCDCCRRTFLSGIGHIDRGDVVALVCYECAEQHATVEKLKTLSKQKWAALRASFNEIERQHENLAGA